MTTDEALTIIAQQNKTLTSQNEMLSLRHDLSGSRRNSLKL